MSAQLSMLLLAGSICLFVTLVEAWCLTAVRHLDLPVAKRLFPGHAYLLKSHLDFLHMCALLFGCALVLDHLAIELPPVLLAAVCVGSVLNPLGFLALAVRPELPQRPSSPFGALMAASFALTTAGYGGIAIMIALRALA